MLCHEKGLLLPAYCQVKVEVCNPYSFLFTPDRVDFLYCWVGLRVLTLHIVSTIRSLGWLCYYWMMVVDSPVFFCQIFLITAKRRWKFRPPIRSVLTPCWEWLNATSWHEISDSCLVFPVITLENVRVFSSALWVWKSGLPFQPLLVCVRP